MPILGPLQLELLKTKPQNISTFSVEWLKNKSKLELNQLIIVHKPKIQLWKAMISRTKFSSRNADRNWIAVSVAGLESSVTVKK